MVRSGVIVRSGSGSFLQLRRSEMARLRLSETLYTQAVHEPDHRHERSYFEIVLKGSYRDEERRSEVEHRALSVAFQPAVAAHSSYISPEGLHSLKVEMSTDWLEQVCEGLGACCLSVNSNFSSGALTWLGVRLYHEWQRMDSVSPLAIEGLVLEMLAEAI